MRYHTLIKIDNAVQSVIYFVEKKASHICALTLSAMKIVHNEMKAGMLERIG